MTARLFAPLTLRGVTFPNRVVISPMCQYSAEYGLANDWHLVQYGRFAVGGAGCVVVEATAVSPEGRITHGDTGFWSDAHTAPLARIATFVRQQGAVPGIQLGHAGRKASIQRPWFGNGPLTAVDAARGDVAWETVGPSALPPAEGWLTPRALDEAGILGLVQSFTEAARRAAQAGFAFLELHAAHGYLLHQFLSPVSNRRNDGWGGDIAGRMRFPLAVARAVREAWPAQLPLSVRISMHDGVDGGRPEEESVAFAQALKALGVDVVDCSSGGIGGAVTAARGPRRTYGFQVPFAERIRREAGIATMAVGLIVDAHQAEQVLAEGKADLIAIGREALENPNWPVHAKAQLGVDVRHETWVKQHGWWLNNRDETLARLGPYPG